MKKVLFILFSICTLALTGCIEIIDDLTINADGSGSFRYTVNLSSSKVKVNSVLALDTLGGKKVPNKTEIEQMILDFKSQLNKEPGISNVQADIDLSHFLVKLSCDFKNVQALQAGIKNTIGNLSKSGPNEMDTYSWISWEDNVLVRSIPQMATQELKKLKQDLVQMQFQFKFQLDQLIHLQV